MQSDPFTLIRDILLSHPSGMKIAKLSELTGLNRNTVAKYAEMLVLSGQVLKRQFGMTKIYIPIESPSPFEPRESHSLFLIIVDRFKRIIHANDAYLKFIGLKKSSLLGMQLRYLQLPLISSPEIEIGINDSLKGIDVKLEVLHNKNDKKRIFSATFTRMDRDDINQFVLILLEDVSEILKSTHGQDINSRIYQMFFDKSSEGSVFTTPDGKILLYNPAFLHIFGFPPAHNIEGLSICDIYSASNEWDTIIQNLESDKPVLQHSSIKKRNDGLFISTIEDIFGIFINDSLLGVHILFRENIISNMPQADNNLMHVNRLPLLDYDRMVIYEWNLMDETILCSMEYMSLFGYPPASRVLSVDFWLDHLHPDDLESTVKGIEEHIAGRRSYAIVEYRMRTKTGDWIWVLDLLRITKWDSYGNPTHLTGIVFTLPQV